MSPSIAIDARRRYTLAATITDDGNMPCRIAASTASRMPTPDGMGTARNPIVHATAYAETTSSGSLTEPKLESNSR